MYAPADRGPHNGDVRALLTRLRPYRPPLPDVLLAVALCAFGIAFLASTRQGDSGLPVHLLPAPPDAPVKMLGTGVGVESSGPGWGDFLGMILLITGPVAGRRRLPLAVFASQLVGVFVVQDVSWPGFISIIIGAYSLARYGVRPALSMAVLLAAGLLVATHFSHPVPDMPGWSAPFLILLPIGLFGTAIRAARARADAAGERAAAVERAQAAATRVALAEERARIARELHDVVSHHVSVMTIQAGAAGKVLAERPELAREAVAAVEASGREAMAELRQLLGVLSPAEDGADAPLRPSPGLGQLDALVAKVRAAGQPVTTRTVPVSLPRAVDLAAYRVIQEALTNALRYAPGARTEVVVDRDADGLVVEVTNDAAATREPVDGTGSGLVGLAERVRLFHGTLAAGRRLGGGFRVRAVIPLDGPS